LLNKRRINIAILEPSQIIFEGLSNILSKSGTYLKLYRIDNLGEIESLTHVEKLDAVIINPAQIQNKTKDFNLAKRSKPEACWIALVYSFFDHHLLSHFDKTIGITDSMESINDMINRLGNSETEHHSPEQEQLSEREIDVLKLIIKGLSNKEIGDALNISIHTVISHRKNISQKTGIKSQSGLTIYAISNKIILLEDYTN
jgi:DNA-binding CsgD family transcriptional regulator